jgi:molybdenum cofactor cytidylyltransferase
MKVAAVVLGAGGSTRFGKPKQLAVFRGETFVRHIIRAAIGAGCAPVVAVVGDNAAEITSEIAGLPVSIVTHRQWSNGVGSSIVVGIQCAIGSLPRLESVILLTCDQPFVNAATLKGIIQLRLTSGRPIVASAYAGTLGVPALFDRSCFPDLLRLEGDSGAKGIIFSRQNEVARFNFPAGAVDIDSIADYENLRQKSARPEHSR